MNFLIRDMPGAERPRERLLQHGAKALSKAELIAILLRVGTRGNSVVQVARTLLDRYQTLQRLCLASPDDLRQIKGIGRDKAATLVAAFELAVRMAGEIRVEAPQLDTPERVADLMREEMRANSVEIFRVLLVNTRRRLMNVVEVSKGTLDAVHVHPREVFRAAIAANASAVILVHNHPSGDPDPSEADVKVTRDLIRAGQILRIDVLDHIIIGTKTDKRDKDYVSLRESGYFY